MSIDSITDEAARAYIDSDGEHCPYCGSINITTTDHDLPYMYVLCLDCKEDWTDTYRLVGVDSYLIPNHALDLLAVLENLLPDYGRYLTLFGLHLDMHPQYIAALAAIARYKENK